jgi:hypothetical protein
VDLVIVWRIVVSELPLVRSQVEMMLRCEDED